MRLANIYKKHYKRLVLVPLILFGLMLLFVPQLKLGIDFTGGMSFSFSSSLSKSPEEIAEYLKTRLGITDVSVTPLSGGYIVEVSYPPKLRKVFQLAEAWKERNDEEALKELNKLLNGKIRDLNNLESYVSSFSDSIKEEIKRTVKEILPDARDFVVQNIVPVLGSEFWELMKRVAMAAAFLLLIAVLIYFRHPIPIIIMILSGLFDGAAMLAYMGLANIPLNLSTMAIVLMMVGYSIDTDVVASTYVFKRRKEGDIFEQAERAFLTGSTMSATTLIAMAVIYLVGFLVRNIAVVRMANVMMFGVLADLVITWLLNTPLLIWVGGKSEAA